MQAIQGIYNQGRLHLDKSAPKKRAKVIVIFTEEPFADESGMSTEEALSIFHKHAGSIKGNLDAKAERLAYLDERYGSID